MMENRARLSLPIESILEQNSTLPAPTGKPIGLSRQGRPILAHAFGQGPSPVSLIGGCHADEPVGPAMLSLLARFLATRNRQDPLLQEHSWFLVPHVNPDGDYQNMAWSNETLITRDHRAAEDRSFDTVRYLQHVVREVPGNDIEFGFPRDSSDDEARPENRAVARFLSDHGPFDLHGSFHGMGFAPGPWFLIEPAWIDRTIDMREMLRGTVRGMGYPLFDLDRQGEKGFHRIDEGFCTRPDSGAMAAHFSALGDEDMASLFRPSSMEYVRGLGGDPLTLVSEMPLFLVFESSADPGPATFQTGTEGRRKLHQELGRLVLEHSESKARSEIEKLGIRAMPIRDQMRLQLAFLNEALNCLDDQR